MADEMLMLLKRFIADDRLTVQDLRQLKYWTEKPDSQMILNKWMQTQWDIAPNLESEVSFEQLITQIDKQYQLRSTENLWGSGIIKWFQKIAAVLILPIIIFTGYALFFNHTDQEQYSETMVSKGQKSEILLPDGTHIWLNSATRLRYPVQFGKHNREVFLEGEAYFEVSPNKQKPFIVHTPDVAIKVLGTSFNVKAYPDEPEIETALIKGSVNLVFPGAPGKTKEVEMLPGEMVNFSKTSMSVIKSGFQTDETIGWKNNRLIFRDDTFSNLVKKIERWYNVKVLYDESLFKDQRLTVELLEGESLDRLMQIIGSAAHLNYRIDKQKIYINTKKKSP